MSEITSVERTRNQTNTTYNVSKLAIGNNEFIEGTYTDSGAGSTLAEGLVMGRVGATQKLVPLDGDATDGSQFPVGVLYLGLNSSITVAASADANLTLVNKGRINAGKLSFGDGEALTDLIGPADNQRSIRDYMESLGLSLEDVTQLAELDNQ